MKYMLAVYSLAFIIAFILFGPVALLHPLGTGLIVGSFYMACDNSLLKAEGK